MKSIASLPFCQLKNTNDIPSQMNCHGKLYSIPDLLKMQDVFFQLNIDNRPVFIYNFKRDMLIETRNAIERLSNTMLYKKKIFTLAEANALVPQLLRDVPRMQELQQKLESDYPNVQKARQNARCDGGCADGPEYLKLVLQFTELSHDLQIKGCILKGIGQGLVDFLSIREGREVFLCWQFPEEGIRYWHDIDAGFAGRNLI